MIYIGNQTTDPGTGTIETFPGSSTGDVSPTSIIRGKKTQIGFLDGVAVDRSGSIYEVSFGRPAILIFAPRSHGDPTPTNEISGSSTLLTGPYSVAIDRDGDIFVKDCNGSCLLEFAPGSTGNVAPVAVISGPHTTLNSQGSIAFDSLENVYVLGDDASGQPEIAEFPKGSTGDFTPVRVISGSRTQFATLGPGIAVDSHGRIYVVLRSFINGRKILIFGAHANGNVAPVWIIHGPKTALRDPAAVAIDSADRIYVADLSKGIEVFDAGARGNVAPSQVIRGPQTHLITPYTIAVQ